MLMNTIIVFKVKFCLKSMRRVSAILHVLFSRCRYVLCLRSQSKLVAIRNDVD